MFNNNNFFFRHLKSELGRLQNQDPVKQSEMDIDDILFKETGNLNNFIKYFKIIKNHL